MSAFALRVARAVVLLQREPHTPERLASRVAVTSETARSWLAAWHQAGYVRRLDSGAWEWVR